jgi:Holliday junction resolvase RusA-like endonuclease
MIIIPGKPQGKQRPRKGKYENFYTPPKTKAYEEKVALCGLKEKGKIKKGEKCKLIIRAYFKGKQSCDLTNLEKSIEDGLQGIVFPNDRQVKEKHSWVFEYQDDEKVEVEVYRS